MNNFVLNNTPIRTSNNFHINDIEIKDIEFPTLKSFSNVKISGESDTEKVEKAKKFGIDFAYGVGNVVEDDGNTIKQVTKDEANELGRLNKEIYEANKRINELMKGV